MFSWAVCAPVHKYSTFKTWPLFLSAWFILICCVQLSSVHQYNLYECSPCLAMIAIYSTWPSLILALFSCVWSARMSRGVFLCINIYVDQAYWILITPKTHFRLWKMLHAAMQSWNHVLIGMTHMKCSIRKTHRVLNYHRTAVHTRKSWQGFFFFQRLGGQTVCCEM